VAKQWVRRAPPAFRRVVVARRAPRTAHLVRVTFSGPELEGFDDPLPAASVRLLVPSAGADLVMPAWDGNEFLLPDGQRPVIRTFTPLRFDPAALELDVDIVLHPVGAVAGWAATAAPGDPAAISGPGRGYTVDPDGRAFVLAGDESALPAMGQLLAVLPQAATVQVLAEVARADARVELPAHPGATVTWLDLPAGSRAGDALVEAVRTADIAAGAHVWAAGEAAAMQRIRKHLFDDRGFNRSQTTVRGYWKHGRAGDADDV
jgi:NADPH-dependent ferric siderophore reductase